MPTAHDTGSGSVSTAHMFGSFSFPPRAVLSKAKERINSFSAILVSRSTTSFLCTIDLSPTSPVSSHKPHRKHFVSTHGVYVRHRSEHQHGLALEGFLPDRVVGVEVVARTHEHHRFACRVCVRLRLATSCARRGTAKSTFTRESARQFFRTDPLALQRSRRRRRRSRRSRDDSSRSLPERSRWVETGGRNDRDRRGQVGSLSNPLPALLPLRIWDP